MSQNFTNKFTLIVNWTVYCSSSVLQLIWTLRLLPFVYEQVRLLSIRRRCTLGNCGLQFRSIPPRIQEYSSAFVDICHDRTARCERIRWKNGLQHYTSCSAELEYLRNGWKLTILEAGFVIIFTVTFSHWCWIQGGYDTSSLLFWFQFKATLNWSVINNPIN